MKTLPKKMKRTKSKREGSRVENDLGSSLKPWPFSSKSSVDEMLWEKRCQGKKRDICGSREGRAVRVNVEKKKNRKWTKGFESGRSACGRSC